MGRWGFVTPGSVPDAVALGHQTSWWPFNTRWVQQVAGGLGFIVGGGRGKVLTFKSERAEPMSLLNTFTSKKTRTSFSWSLSEKNRDTHRLPCTVSSS